MSRTLPHGFVEMLRGYKRPDITDVLLAALSDSDPAISVRLNSRRQARFAIDGKPVPWLADTGIYLDVRPNFALDPAWHQGLYYVQDASSMVMTEVVKRIVATCFVNSPVRYLDVCAAPGGKSIAAAEALPAGSCLLSNEYDPRRAAVLAENMGKYGVADVAVSQGDTSKIARIGEIFDIVAVDAPCSGEGMMRKEPEAIAQWSEDLVARCADLQRKILADSWSALRPGGVLVYSTCTFNRLENELNLDFIVNGLGGESLDLSLDSWSGVKTGIDTPWHCYRFLPGHIAGEGLFVCAVKKPEGSVRSNKAKKVAAVKNQLAEKALRDYLVGDFALRVDKGGNFYAVPASESGFFDYLAENLRLLSCGIPLGSVKGKDFIPAWQLAFSENFSINALPSLELDYDGALSFLHGDSLTSLPDGLPKGIVTAKYRGRPLGFVKNIGRRANNLYPDRIRLRLDPAKAVAADLSTIVKN